MSLGLCYWILMLLWLVLGTYWSWPARGGAAIGPLGSALLVFALLVLLGWRVFGPPLKG